MTSSRSLIEELEKDWHYKRHLESKKEQHSPLEALLYLGYNFTSPSYNEKNLDQIDYLIDQLNNCDILISAEIENIVPGKISLLTWMIRKSIQLLESFYKHGFTYASQTDQVKLHAERRLLDITRKIIAKTKQIDAGDSHPFHNIVGLGLSRYLSEGAIYKTELLNYFLKTQPISQDQLKQTLHKSADCGDIISMQIILPYLKTELGQNEKNDLFISVMHELFKNHKHSEHTQFSFIASLTYLIDLGADLNVIVPQGQIYTGDFKLDKPAYLVILQTLGFIWFYGFLSESHWETVYIELLKRIIVNNSIDKGDDILFAALDTAFYRSQNLTLPIIKTVMAIQPHLLENPIYQAKLLTTMVAKGAKHKDYYQSLLNAKMDFKNTPPYDLNALLVALLENTENWQIPTLIQQLILHGVDVFHPDDVHLIEKLAVLHLTKEIVTLFNKNPLHNQKLLEAMILKKFFVDGKVTYFEWYRSLGLLSAKFITFFTNNKQHRNKPALILKDYKYNLEYIAQLLEDEEYLKHFSTHSLIQFLNNITELPDAKQFIYDCLGKLKSIEFFDSGVARSNWWKLTKKLIDAAPPTDEYKKSQKTRLDRVLSASLNATDMTIFKELKLNNQFIESLELKLLDIQGRTVKLLNKERHIFAIKIQKGDELPFELVKEYKTTEFLRAKAKELKLQSQFPQPLGVYHVSNVFEWLKNKVSDKDFEQLTKLVRGCSNECAYIYLVNAKHANYFTYPHYLSNDMFAHSYRVATHDLSVLLSQGIVFSQLIDLFHNTEGKAGQREDLGRYIVLADLLAKMSFIGDSHWRPQGNGRLTAWMPYFPNTRGTGLADFGDWSSLNEWINNGAILKKYFGTALSSYRDKTGNYVIANIIAEYQYSLFLIAGYRGVKLDAEARSQEKTANEIFSIWQDLANQVLSNCAITVAILTRQTETRCKQLLSAQINVQRLARQMQFWMTDEYIPHLQNNKLPDDIYEKDTKVVVDIKRFRPGTFDEKMGCSIDGERKDLGPVNGQEPNKEMNKLLYKMIDAIFIAYHSYQQTRADLIRIKNDEKKSEELQLNSFTHLPKKEYHCMQYLLFKKRLKDVKSAQDEKHLAGLAQLHKESYLAAGVVSKWKNLTH